MCGKFRHMIVLWKTGSSTLLPYLLCLKMVNTDLARLLLLRKCPATGKKNKKQRGCKEAKCTGMAKYRVFRTRRNDEIGFVPIED